MKFNDLKSSLKEVLSTQATSYEYGDTLEFLMDKCWELGADNVEIDEHDNLYVTKGIADVYPCVVSHTDTVHDIYKGYKVYEVKGSFVAFDSDTMRQVGVGGDDKVGMWVCLEMLRRFDNIKIAFFAQEEIGCVGSSHADFEFFSNVGYALECDRQGSSDFVQKSSGVKMFGEEFEKLISSTLKDYGYSIKDGGLTDVHEIAQDMGIACANMSCGYYNPHSKQEYVKIKEAINTFNLVKSLVTLLGETMHSHKAEDTYASYGYGASYGSKKSKKVINSSPQFSGCDMCGAISTDGCDFCVTESTYLTSTTPSSKVKVTSYCTCGGELRSYGAGVNKYTHCYSCGYYEDALTPLTPPF